MQSFFDGYEEGDVVLKRAVCGICAGFLTLVAHIHTPVNAHCSRALLLFLCLNKACGTRQPQFRVFRISHFYENKQTGKAQPLYRFGQDQELFKEKLSGEGGKIEGKGEGEGLEVQNPGGVQKRGGREGRERGVESEDLSEARTASLAPSPEDPFQCLTSALQGLKITATDAAPLGILRPLKEGNGIGSKGDGEGSKSSFSGSGSDSVSRWALGLGSESLRELECLRDDSFVPKKDVSSTRSSLPCHTIELCEGEGSGAEQLIDKLVPADLPSNLNEYELSSGNEAVYDSSNVDPFALRFSKKVAIFPDQILRHSFDGAPLWVASPDAELRRALTGLPACPRCGAARVFEFQLFAHLLDLLREKHPRHALLRRLVVREDDDLDEVHFVVSKNGDNGTRRKRAPDRPAFTSLDEILAAVPAAANWSTAAIYVCKADCWASQQASSDFAEELVLVQSV